MFAGASVQSVAAVSEKMHIPDAKLLVMGMTSTGFTIADPTGPEMFDIYGFDSAVPELLKEFVLETSDLRHK